jgi:hypothetical protein
MGKLWTVEINNNAPSLRVQMTNAVSDTEEEELA